MKVGYCFNEICPRLGDLGQIFPLQLLAVISQVVVVLAAAARGAAVLSRGAAAAEGPLAAATRAATPTAPGPTTSSQVRFALISL